VDPLADQLDQGLIDIYRPIGSGIIALFGQRLSKQNGTEKRETGVEGRLEMFLDLCFM